VEVSSGTASLDMHRQQSTVEAVKALGCHQKSVVKDAVWPMPTLWLDNLIFAGKQKAHPSNASQPNMKSVLNPFLTRG